MAAPAPDRNFHTLFNRAAAFDEYAVGFVALSDTFGHGVVTAMAGVRERAVDAASRTPIVLAVVSADDHEHISIVHTLAAYPRSIATDTVMDGNTFATCGDEPGALQHIQLHDHAFGRATIRCLDDAVAIRAVLTDAAPFHPEVAAGTPNSAEVQVRRALVLPVEWAAAAAGGVRYTPAAFYDAHIAPLDAGQQIVYAECIRWWRVTSTLVAGAVPSLSTTGTTLTLGNRALVQAWRARVTQSWLDKIGPPGGVIPVTNAVFTAAMTDMGTRLDTHHDQRERREDAHDAPQTFAGRYTENVRDEIFNIINVANEANLPPLLRQLATHKKQADDIPAIRAALDGRSDEIGSMADEYSRPTATTQLIAMMRDWRLICAGDELTAGLTPFTIVCAGHADHNATRDTVDTLRRLEQGANSMSYQDAQVFSIAGSNLPSDEMQCADKLRGFSVVVDIIFGDANAMALDFRNFLNQYVPFLQSGLRSYYRDSPGKRLHIRLRSMYYITMELQYYIKMRRQGLNPPLPAWAALLKMMSLKNFDTILPDLPEAWLQKVTPQGGSPAPAPGPTPAPQAAAPENTPVVNRNVDAGLKERFANSGYTSLKDMTKVARDAGRALSIPKIDGTDACLSWMIKGSCWKNCRRSAAHKYASPAVVAKVHEVMDACDVAQH